MVEFEIVTITNIHTHAVSMNGKIGKVKELHIHRDIFILYAHNGYYGILKTMTMAWNANESTFKIYKIQTKRTEDS
jgi:hypothetical protein